MEFTEVSEKRFERAMERLFSGSSTPAASSAGGPSPAKKKKMDQQNRSQTAGDVEPSPVAHGCRPWDRGDLLRRLATYKSISWFGKPQVAGPVACARRGWVNVDIDLLACEACGSRLSFPVPPSWPRHQVERAALAFAEQLETAHKSLCTWKNNPCADTLAYFPPTPVADLRGAYTDRCEALLQLSALPVISETAKYQMKLSRGPQLDRLLSEPSPRDPAFLNGNGVSSSSSENEFFAMNKGFYESQRMIAVCGWEPRLLPYTVDYEDRSEAPANEQTGTSQGTGPSVTIHLKGDLQQAKVPQSQIQPNAADSSDPASAVLDCNLCGASVGLWNFTTVNRPAPLLSSGFEEILSSKKNHVESGAVNELEDVPGLAISEAADALDTKPLEVVLVNTLGRAAPQKGVLDLKLTIAGGPPPTRLNAPVSVVPSLGTPALLHTGVQSKRGEAATYAAASYESRRPERQERDAGYGGSSLETVPYDRSLPAGNGKDKLVDARETDDLEGGLFSRNAKRKREAVGSQWPGRPVKQPVLHLPHASSVNAIDSRYLPKQENSVDESVDNLPPDCDGQWANTAEYHGNGPKSVVQAEHSIHHEYGNGRVKSKSAGGFEESARTNEVVITFGTGVSAGVGGLEWVGLGGSSEAEIHGLGTCLERTGSVAGFATDGTELMEEFLSGHDLMDDIFPEEAGTVDVKDNDGISQQAVPDISHHTFVNDTLSAGESGRFQGKRNQREADEDTNAESTIDTTNAVIQGHDVDASLQVKEVIDGHMSEESPVQRNEEVQSHPFFPPGLPSEDVRKLEIQTRQFDPIRQHRHFCPWVNGHVAAATTSSTGPGIACGWQIVLDALQDQSSVTGFAASEFAASKRKGDPLLSVRKFLGSASTSQPPRT